MAVVAQEGYRLNERVLRPARVVVVEGQAASGAAETQAASGGAGWKDSTSMRAHWVSGWSGSW